MAKNPRLIDLTGQRFGRWLVLQKAGNTARGAATWQCRCECGTERDVIGVDLRKGKSRSCGCEGAGRIARERATHRMSGTRLHRIWGNMRKRCLNPKTPGYENYGGRGISICSAWEDFAAFNEWAMTAGYRDNLSIERLDVNGNYEPDNCIWADAQAQSENRRFVAKAPSGQLWCHIARDNGITDDAYRSRIANGWSFHQAATWPMNKRRRDGNLSRAVYVTIGGENLPVAHAAKRIGYSPAALYQRSKRKGITMQAALDELAASPR